MLASAPMSIPDTIPLQVRKRLEKWLTRWGVPSLSRNLRVEFSPRLRRAFGRCYQDERLIRLTPSLLGSQSHLLAEILCHEAAHAAVHELHGSTARPHGEEWEELMRMVGFEPRVRIPVVVHGHDQSEARDRVLYLHRCPSCKLSRHAARPMHQWRCRTCVKDGSDGRLVIRRQHDAVRERQGSRQASEERRRAVASNGRKARTSAR